MQTSATETRTAAPARCPDAHTGDRNRGERERRRAVAGAAGRRSAMPRRSATRPAGPNAHRP